MDAIKDLFKSEKGIMAIVVLLAGTAFCVVAKLPFGEWKDFALWVLGIYTGGKSLQGAASAFGPKPSPAAATPPASPTM